MKTLITVITLAALATSGAVAKTRAAKVDFNNIYQSHAQGNQSYPNPDRVFPAEPVAN